MFGDKNWDMFYGQHIYMTLVHTVYKFSLNKQEELKENICNESLDMIKIILYVVKFTPLIRRVLVRMIGFIISWLHTHS
jgi:hypothetical protein